MSNKGKESFDRFLKEFLDNPFQNTNERIEKGSTVLHYAAQLPDAETIKLLIELRATVNARDDNGETALHLAAFLGKVENVKAGAEVNAISNNRAVPLHLACLARRIETIEVLINSGGNIDAIDEFGCSPLNYAKIHPKVIEKKGVNMRDVPPTYGKANEVIEEIMERHETKVVSLIEEILSSKKTEER